MAKAPAPITAAPAPNGPHDATAPGTGDAQSDATHVYDAAGGPEWVKVQEGGACDMSGRITGRWPGNGSSSDGGWAQV